MRTKNVNFKAVILVIVLFVISGITAYKFLGPGAEDIIKSKKFMEKLYSKGNRPARPLVLPSTISG